MLPLLLAVITVAAARYLPLVYPFENEIESLSPLIRYSSGPLWVNPTIVSRNTSTSLPQRNVTQDDVPMDAPGLFPLDQSAFKPFLEKGWTALYAAEYDVRYPYYYVSTGAVGDSFTFSIPSSVEARVFGKSIDAQVSVDVDGVQHPDVQVSESTLDSYFEFPIKNIQRGPGLLNVTVTLRRGMITISRLRFQFPPSDYSTDWWELEDVLAYSQTRNGSWRNATKNARSEYLETSEAGAKLSVDLKPRTVFVNLRGYSNGSYAVRCIPTPPNMTDTTYYGYTSEAEVTLYSAVLDASTRYTLELTNLANTTGITHSRAQVLGRAQVPRKSSDSNRKLIFGLSLGLGIPAFLAILAYVI